MLDAVVDHGISDPQISADILKSAEDGWKAFKQWCADTANECRLRGQNLDAVFDQVLAKARSPGIPAPLNFLQPNRPVNDWELNFMLEAMMAPGNRFAWMEAMLYEASQNNDASLAGLIYDSSIGNTRRRHLQHGSGGILRGIHCVDSRWSQLVPNASRGSSIYSGFQSDLAAFRRGWLGPGEPAVLRVPGCADRSCAGEFPSGSGNTSGARDWWDAG